MLNARDLIIELISSPNLETEPGTFNMTGVIIKVRDEEYSLESVWYRGDDQLMLEAKPCVQQ